MSKSNEVKLASSKKADTNPHKDVNHICHINRLWCNSLNRLSTALFARYRDTKHNVIANKASVSSRQKMTAKFCNIPINGFLF